MPPKKAAAKKSRAPTRRTVGRVVTMRGVRQGVRGDGFFGDVWSGIKKAANWTNDALKKTKLISTVMGVIPQTAAYAPVARAIGYGGKRRKVRRCGGAMGGPRKALKLRTMPIGYVY